MSRRSREVFNFINKIVYQRQYFIFWLFIRFVSALFPILSIYLFSQTIKLLEVHADSNSIYLLVGLILFVYVVDNLTRLLSIYKLQFLISNTEFAIHKFMIDGLTEANKEDRHASIQAIRNFSEAVRTTLELIRQPGIDSFVFLVSIPIILFFLDFKIFILQMAYVLIYYFVDLYTTDRYYQLKDIQDAKTECYYAVLQDHNDTQLESSAYTRHFRRLCNWGFFEWFTLQNIAVIFYSIALLYLIFQVSSGQKHISDLVLIIGYISQTQVLLNNFSTIKDRLADTQVALTRLAKSKSISAIDLDDLV